MKVFSGDEPLDPLRRDFCRITGEIASMKLEPGLRRARRSVIRDQVIEIGRPIGRQLFHGRGRHQRVRPRPHHCAHRR